MVYKKHGPLEVASIHFPKERNGHFSIFPLENAGARDMAGLVNLDRAAHFEIIVVNQGHGMIAVDSTQYRIDDGSMILILPGQYRHFQNIGNATGYCLSFSADFLLSGAARMYCISWCIGHAEHHHLSFNYINHELHDEINALFKKMTREFDGTCLFRKEVLSGLLNILLIDISRNLPPGLKELMGPRENELTRKFTALVETNYKTQKRVCDYAVQLCVSPNYLNTVIKKSTGRTAKYHIQQRILSEAKRVLVSVGNMKETGYHLGFEDPAHFSKFFKRNAGMNFKTYRKSFF